MTEPAIAQTAPFGIELEPGTYWWCARGRSAGQPFSYDGSHEGNDFAPVKLEISEKTRAWLRGCKRSADRPFCDGSHTGLEIPGRTP
jgi:CDGSH-type Zn-finger protein